MEDEPAAFGLLDYTSSEARPCRRKPKTALGRDKKRVCRAPHLKGFIMGVRTICATQKPLNLHSAERGRVRPHTQYNLLGALPIAWELVSLSPLHPKPIAVVMGANPSPAHGRAPAQTGLLPAKLGLSSRLPGSRLTYMPSSGRLVAPFGSRDGMEWGADPPSCPEPHHPTFSDE